MNDWSERLDLGPAARQRRQAILPGLLAAVRRRRRRRRVIRAGAAALVVALAAVWLPSLRGGASEARPQPHPQPVRAEARPGWTTFRDDPTALARCTVATVTRPEWFVDDDGLNALLRAAGRRPGVVRAAGRVEVNPASVDPWPEAESE